MDLCRRRGAATLTRSTPLTAGHVHGLNFIVVLGVVSIDGSVLVFFRAFGDDAGAFSGSDDTAVWGPMSGGVLELCVVSDDGRLHSWAGGIATRVSPGGDRLGVAAFHDRLGSDAMEVTLSVVVPDAEPAVDSSVLVRPGGLLIPLR